MVGTLARTVRVTVPVETASILRRIRLGKIDGRFPKPRKEPALNPTQEAENQPMVNLIKIQPMIGQKCRLTTTIQDLHPQVVLRIFQRCRGMP